MLVLLAFSIMQAVGFIESLGLFGSPLESYEISYALEVWLPRLIYPLVAVILLVSSSLERFRIANFLSLPVLGVVILAALQIRAGNVTMGLVAAAFFVVWITQWMPSSLQTDRAFEAYGFDALLFYLIVPIVLLCALFFLNSIDELPDRYQIILSRMSNAGFFRAESFRGFARDRIAYSYLCGIAVLHLLATRDINFKSLLWLGFLFLGLCLAGSRAVFIALAVAGCSLLASKRQALIVLVCGLLVVMGAGFVAGRPDFLEDSGNRWGIFSGYLNFFRENPLLFLTGEGRFHAEITFGDSIGIRAHSWPVNSIMNFGILVTLAWVVFLYAFFKKLNGIGRATVIYFVTVGLFHNGFDAYLFSMEQLLGFLLAMTLSMNSPRSFFCVSKDGRRNGTPQLT